MAAASSSEDYTTARAFVQNLPPSTTSEGLLAHFTAHDSNITDAKVFRDPTTGASSGCGMLTFPASHEADVMLALNTESICILDGVQVEIVRLLSKEEQEWVEAGAQVAVRRWNIDYRRMSRHTLFLTITSTRHTNIDKDVLMTHFCQFGKILEAQYDPSDRHPSGFITFDSEESLEAALLLDSDDDEENEESSHEIQGVKVWVERAKKSHLSRVRKARKL